MDLIITGALLLIGAVIGWNILQFVIFWLVILFGRNGE